MSDAPYPRVVPAGDAAALVVFGEEINLELNGRVRALAAALDRRQPAGLRGLVPAYASLLIHYDPLVLTFRQVTRLVTERLGQAASLHARTPRLREIPAVFGGPYGPDLPDIARHHRLSEEEVLRLFTGATYVVYMLGFAPGHPYLGGLPPGLTMPRLERPRQQVPAGTVALANQVVIYSVSTPGGWRWIGRTPLKLFNSLADPPTYLLPGDRVRFVPMPEEEYLEAGGQRCPC